MDERYTCHLETPAVDDDCRLRAAAGLTPRDAAAAAIGLPKTVVGVVVRRDGRAVGMGRAIGDGLFYQIVDIAVDPGHQGHGLGKAQAGDDCGVGRQCLTSGVFQSRGGWMVRFWLLLGLVWLLVLPLHAGRASEPYRVAGDCGGFPKTALLSVPGSCVGLVATGLVFPRGVAVAGANVYVVEMGGWTPDRGRLVRLGHGGHDKPMVLLAGLDEPSALKFGPDGQLYIGLLGEIARVNLGASPVTLSPVVVGLPMTGRHPLTAFAFGPGHALYVNIGSATDHCEGAGGAPPVTTARCPETAGSPPRAAVIEATTAPGVVTDAAAAPVVARGLRNSEGLAVLPDGEVAAAVNARDYIGLVDKRLDDEQEPHDTLDILRLGADFGWPYCFDENRASPEYPGYDCGGKTAPTILLPAHAAPLDLLVYQGDGIPALAHSLVIPYHGYRRNGHRLMAMALSGSGGLSGRFLDVVWGWDARAGVNPMGNPVALAEMADGSVLVTEDHNGTLLRLARD